MRFEDLSPELRKKIGACATIDDLRSLLKSEGVEPTADMLKAVESGLAKAIAGGEKPSSGGFGGTTGGAF